ncbi:hypothetical protein [Desulfoplanes formicivorans]|uniref:Uncharacterized protein n=1 Tax=Desulfoplanes formicivorans TaxID=1592317 RepID=A0A194AL18_9BACT|nr:hypothetical protein [Desulfoplanes formicivorans]GAU09384.1 hypothetical protein DPF_2110 [Desulfoplanes formicivorans]
MSTEYLYSQGNLLEDRHTYQYSQYMGYDFLKSWKESRNMVAVEFGTPLPPPTPQYPYQPLSTPIRTTQRLEELMAGLMQGMFEELRQELGIWVKKFEVSKRLFDTYDSDFKPVTKDKYDDLSNYLRYAEIMEFAYRQNADLPYLNVLLKVIDTLIAYSKYLLPENQARLAWLIKREIYHVGALADKNGLKI